jgi:hypothetical protein
MAAMRAGGRTVRRAEVLYYFQLQPEFRRAQNVELE